MRTEAKEGKFMVKWPVKNVLPMRMGMIPD